MKPIVGVLHCGPEVAVLVVAGERVRVQGPPPGYWFTPGRVKTNQFDERNIDRILEQRLIRITGKGK